MNSVASKFNFSGDRDYIGFATLPEQIHRKSVKRGFDFTLMVVGESGLGKSTLVNSLFLSDLYKDRQILDVADKLERTTTIERKTMDIEERGVKLRLTVVDTPGKIENPKHSDFNKLRNMLITTHMQDLKDVTEDVHYENFRAQCISQISQQAFRERGKLKRDSVPLNMDPAMITETDRLLLQKDEEIRRMQDMLAQMQQKLKATTHSNDNIVNI
ncbi:unnamed protein product [Nesidiocoris tenuis]|uniref:Septin-type G domain-containing protein n=1 Tax=Nesidiocoris tenuis TaxID=355587 RepID=A0A6H5HG39_9HEMI|nr:unnamed protein product [Nesidiocoris tenuis]